MMINEVDKLRDRGNLKLPFRFGSWNVNSRRLTAAHIAFLRGHELDLLALQEAPQATHADLLNAGIFDWGVSSLALRPLLAGAEKARSLGVSLFGRSSFKPVSSTLLENLHFPERSLAVHVETKAGPLAVCSFHIPPGASWGKIKPETQKAIAQWLGQHEGSLIFGIDANAPKQDHPDPEKNIWWWEDEPLLLGHAPAHPLRDAFRLFLEDRPAVFEGIRQASPKGPLAVSHFRGRGSHRTACRYDFIFVTPDIRPEQVDYVFDKTLSDHALVAGNFNVSKSVEEFRGHAPNLRLF